MGEDYKIMPFPSQTIISDHGGAEITITSQRVIIKEPDKYHPKVGEIPGDLIELSMNDIHHIVNTISDKFGVDISKDNFKSQFKS